MSVDRKPQHKSKLTPERIAALISLGLVASALICCASVYYYTLQISQCDLNPAWGGPPVVNPGLITTICTEITAPFSGEQLLFISAKLGPFFFNIHTSPNVQEITHLSMFMDVLGNQPFKFFDYNRPQTP